LSPSTNTKANVKKKLDISAQAARYFLETLPLSAPLSVRITISIWTLIRVIIFPTKRHFVPIVIKRLLLDHTTILLLMREFSKLVTIVGKYSTDALDATYVERQSPSASKAQKYI
jgi:hypothetical protein